MKPVSTSTVLHKLGKLYTPPRTFLDWTTPFELLLATILSAQCTDARVNIVTKTLFLKYKHPRDIVAVTVRELEGDIRSCGYYHTKARYLHASCRMILEKFGGEVPDTMGKLLQLPGVGRKTATVILYAVFGKQEGIAVDTHVWRVSKRLGLSKANTQDKIELDLMNQTARKNWGRLHTLLIMHGRNTCIARSRKCDQCVFKKECPSSLTQNRPDLAKE